MKTTGDHQLVKQLNRSVLLRLLRMHPGLSRAQLAHSSGLTKSTVSLLVRELIDEKWLCDHDATSATGLGRPSTPVYIDANCRVLMGLEIAVAVLRLVGVNLLGAVLWSEEETLTSHEPDDVCRQAATMIGRACTRIQTNHLTLTGMGVGVPGAFNEATGNISFAANLGWWNISFQSKFTTAWTQAGLPPIPVHIQNEADTAALSEYEFGEVQATQSSLIYVTCDEGVGAGIILNDRLFTGRLGMAGEVGHSTLQLGGALCSCGRRGCAETFFGRKALDRLPDPSLGGHYLAMVLHNLWTSFDPYAFVLGGPSCERYPRIVAVAQTALQDYAQQAGMSAPPVRTARYGLWAPAVGAAALVLHHQLRPLHRDRTHRNKSDRTTAHIGDPNR